MDIYLNETKVQRSCEISVYLPGLFPFCLCYVVSFRILFFIFPLCLGGSPSSIFSSFFPCLLCSLPFLPRIYISPRPADEFTVQQPDWVPYVPWETKTYHTVSHMITHPLVPGILLWVLDLWTWEKNVVPETSVTNYEPTPYKIPNQGKSASTFLLAMSQNPKTWRIKRAITHNTRQWDTSEFRRPAQLTSKE